MLRYHFSAALALVLCMMVPCLGWSQNYPSKPIRIIVPFGPGSTSDVIARLMGKVISSELGQPVIIDNRPGASGVIGSSEVARAAPDGYTLVLGTVASHGVATFMMQGVKYDPLKDFQPITLLANAPSVIVVHRSIPASNLKEFIEYAKSHPGIEYSSAGTGTTTHLAGEALKRKAGIEITHVPYKAVGQAITDLLAGHVKVMIYQVPSLKDFVKSHGVKMIAATSASRISTLPEVAAVSEMYPGFDFSAWFGMFAPANTPKTIVERLHKAVLKGMDSAEVKQLMVDQGLEPSGLAPDAFQSFMKEDLQKWKEIITATGAKVQ